jgi:hypothetical protein
MNHTPGPWHIGRRLRATIEGEEHATLFDSIEVPAVAGGGIALVPAHHEADSLLIAAGPDLLEAARAALSRFNEDRCDGYHEQHPATLLRAAIAKAEGREGQ